MTLPALNAWLIPDAPPVSEMGSANAASPEKRHCLNTKSDLPALTLLYVPADRPERVEKALRSTADIVAIDLEDAVAPNRKTRGRTDLARALEGCELSRAIQVRINPLGSQWHEDDLECVSELPPEVSVRLPKVSSGADIEAVGARLDGRSVHAIIESPLGVENAFEIANSGVSSIALGEADLRSGLGLPLDSGDSSGLFWARARIVNAAAAAGLVPPLMSVYTRIRDLEGLRETSVGARELGFMGRSAIHPIQLDVIREAFSPSADEIDRARNTLGRLRGAHADGSGTVVLEDGSFLDAAMIKASRRTTALSEAVKNNVPVSET